MSTLSTALLVAQLLGSLFLVVVIIFQSGKRSGLSGSISGMSESFMSQNKARGLDAQLARATKWVAALWVIVIIALLISLG